MRSSILIHLCTFTFADDAIFVYSIGINEVKYTCARIWRSKRGGGLLLETYMQGFSSYFVCE